MSESYLDIPQHTVPSEISQFLVSWHDIVSFLALAVVSS